jgi:hypothetical protein
MRKLVIGALAIAAAVSLAIAATTATAVVCTSVENHSPVGVSDHFPSDVGSLTCVSEVREGTGKIVHVWFHGDRQVASIELGAKGERWRTWSIKRIPSTWTGPWHVEVRNADGTVLAKAEFTIDR